MLAAYAAATGGNDPLANLALGEQPDPVPARGWALLRVRAASLNHHDLWTLRGISSRPITPPQILGCDAAGTVVAYGEDAPGDAPPVGAEVVAHSVISCGDCMACRSGDQLLCRRLGLLSEGDYPGTLAELVTVPAHNLLPRPEALDPVAAACLPTAYLTAYRMLFTRAGLQPGQTVLVQGASGGVATAAILLARAAGIAVIVTSRDAGKRVAAVELGALAALPPEREAARDIAALAGGRGVDAVLETVGEPTWDLSLRAVRPGGAVVVSGATGGANPPAQLNRVFWRQIAVLGSTMGTRAELERVVALCVTTGLRPLVDRVYPLTQVCDAMARLAAGEQRGKIVVTVG